MDGVRAGGDRRIDRVLAEGYLDQLATRPLSKIRGLREQADQEETDLSYLRRLLQARLDLVQDELDRRAEGRPVPADLVAHLTQVLTDDHARAAAPGSGRHRTVEPSRAGESRRHVEQLVSDDLLTDLPQRTSDELGLAAATLRAEEGSVSSQRAAVQRVFDVVSAEITRRYREGEADIGELLSASGDPDR